MDNTIIFEDGNDNNPMTEKQGEVSGRVVSGEVKPSTEYPLHASYGDSLLALDELNDIPEQNKEDSLKELEQRIIKGITEALKKQKAIIYTAESQKPSWGAVQVKSDLDHDYFKAKVMC